MTELEQLYNKLRHINDKPALRARAAALLWHVRQTIGRRVERFGTCAASRCRDRQWLRLTWFFWGFESLGEWMVTDNQESKRVTWPRLSGLFR